MSTSTTSIRVTTDTRDRLNALATELGHKSVEALLHHLMDEHWKTRCIEQADRWRDNDPFAWREQLSGVAWRERYWAAA